MNEDTMKKLLFILPLLLVACTEQGFVQKLSAPSETIYNDKCAEIQEYRIFQVIDNGSLAMACDSEYSDICIGLTVFVPKIKGEIYYDDMVIKPKDNQCIIYDDVYRYTTNSGNNKTVPKLKFADKHIPNPAYTEWVKSQPAN